MSSQVFLVLVKLRLDEVVGINLRDLEGSDMIATVNYHSRSGLWYNHADGNGTKYEYDAL